VAEKPRPPSRDPEPPGDSVAGRRDEERTAESVRQALEREAAEAEAAAALGPDEPSPERGGEGRLKLDKSGALIGVEKLKPVRAHGRPEGESAPGAARAAPTPQAAGSASTAAASTSAGPSGRASSGASDAASRAAASPPAPPGAPRRAVLPPRIGTYVPPGFPGTGEGGDEVEIPAGAFLYGEDRQTRSLGAFRVERLPVTHAAYERFVRETGHRPPLYWPAGHLPEDLRDHPVVGVDYFDALAYARWAGLDLPYEDEWERAARGTDGRTWPWGDAGDLPASNTARTGYKMTLPVGFYPENESPDGVKDLVGNTWEITHSPAPGGGVVVRGGSWFDFAFHAKSWFRFAARPTARNGSIGFRCVRRPAPRTDAPREVDPSVVEAEIAARRGPQAPIDPSQFSADRRDLVPDIRRLRVLLAEKQVNDAVGAASRSAVAPPPPSPAAPPVPAVPPRPSAVAPPPKPPPPKPPGQVDEVHERPTRAWPDAAAASPPAPLATPSSTPLPAPAGDATHAAEVAAEASREAASRDREAPLHVLLPTGSAASHAAAAAASAAAAAATAAAAAAEAARNAPPPPPPPPPTLEQLAAQKTPPALWALLAVGFALLIGLLIWLVTSGNSGDEPGPGGDGPVEPGPVEPGPGAPGAGRTPTPEEPSDLPPEPAPGQAALDGQPGRLLDGASGTWRERLGAGAWLLVFAGGADEAAAASTRASALSLHRRYLGTGLNVALVVPRGAFERGDGTLIEPQQREAALTSLSARDGITVLLDPRHDQRDAIRESRYGLATPNAALLLVEGQVEVLTQPPQGPMTLRHLGRIAERARGFLR
jgi:hypothetical protein